MPGQAAELRKRILIVAVQKRSLHGLACVLWSAAVTAAQDSAKPRGPGPSCVWRGGSHPALSCSRGRWTRAQSEGSSSGFLCSWPGCLLLLPTACCSPPALRVPTLSPGAVSLFLFLIRLLGADRCPYNLLTYPCPLTELSLHVFHGHMPPLPRSWSHSHHVPCTHLTGLALSPAQATSAFLSRRALIQPSL